MSGVVVKAILPGYVCQEWPEAKPCIEKAIPYSHGEITIEQVEEGLMTGTTRLLTIRDGGEMIAAVVVSIHQYPAKKVCQVSYAGGEQMDKWAKQGFPVVVALAKQAGATSVLVQGRRGWLRELKQYGFEEYSTLIGMEI